MNVEFWGVGCTGSTNLPMTHAHICSHLLSDWVPSLPLNVSSSFIGWPPFLIDVVQYGGADVSALRLEAGRSERQWKGFLSWMLGVAGTRHVLATEGYRWVAPLSAFYEEAVQEVDISGWYPLFPPGVLTANANPASNSHVRPDYVALRRLSSGSLEWAVVESKGTNRSLRSLSSCPGEWYEQVRNIELRVNGNPISIPRYLVVATRVNPNAKKVKSRRIQLRAWNSVEESPSSVLPREFAPAIAIAHMFGLFRSLRLVDNARALASSVRTWHARRFEQGVFDLPGHRDLELADAELVQHGSEPQGTAPLQLPIETDFGTLKVEIASATISLVRKLQRVGSLELAAAAVEEADRELDFWESHARRAMMDVPEGRSRAVLPFGIQVQLPELRSR